ncbi:FeoB-associated Cys-rich membrane protein [Clostridiaceae bacterium]|nr:FeoB-associated Cys-rich membrane protein [Clostridiaceae bacterium]
MPAWLGNGIVIAILICACGLAVRSIWKARKNGCHCSGNCGSCSKCGRRPGR